VTKFEVVAYAVSLSVLTFAFAYVKAPTLNEILVVIPTVLVTSIIVEFTKNYVISVVARMKGVWTEHRLWYFGLVLFLFSSFVFRVPFSSPSRLTHNAPKFTKKSLGLVSAAQVLVAFAFAVVFYGLFISGYTLIGNIGIVMCLTMAFFDSIPIPPMNGKDIYDWSKFLWLSLFISAFTLYMLVLFTL
jgi:Zn-dependent protease